MAAWYDVNRNSKGQVDFTLKGDKGETLLRSEQYEAKASAMNGIASVRNNCGNDARYEAKQSSDGRFFFNLKAGNHQVIGTSPLFKTAAERDACLAAVKAGGGTETVKDDA